MPSFSISLRSSTSTLRPKSLAELLAPARPARSACSGCPAGWRTRAPSSRRRRSPSPRAKPGCTALASRLAHSSVTRRQLARRRRARLGVRGRGRWRRRAASTAASACAASAPRRRRRRRPRAWRRRPCSGAEAAGDRGLERLGRAVAGDRDQHHARRRDAGRPVQVEQLAGLEREVAVRRRRRPSSAGERRPWPALDGRRPTSDEQRIGTSRPRACAGARVLSSKSIIRPMQ